MSSEMWYGLKFIQHEGRCCYVLFGVPSCITDMLDYYPRIRGSVASYFTKVRLVITAQSTMLF